MKQLFNLPTLFVWVSFGLLGVHFFMDSDGGQVSDVEYEREAVVEESFQSESGFVAVEATEEEGAEPLLESKPKNKIEIRSGSPRPSHNEIAKRIEQMLRQVLVDFNKGRYEDIVLAMQQALQLDPENVEAEEALAAAYFELGQYEEAEQVFKSIITKEPENVVAFEQLAESFEARGMANEAVEFLSQHIENNPNHIAASAVLGSILSIKKDSVAAAEILTGVYKKVKGPKGSIVHQLGGAYLDGGAPEKAVQLFQDYMVEIEKMKLDANLAPEQRNLLRDESIDVQEKLAYAHLRENDCSRAAATLQSLKKHAGLDDRNPIAQTFRAKCDRSL